MCHRRERAGRTAWSAAIGRVGASPEIFSIWTMTGPAKPDLVLEGPGVGRQLVLAPWRVLAGATAGLLGRLVPGVEALLPLRRVLLRRVGAVDHVGRLDPGLVLEVRGAARQNLVGRADGRL